MVSFVFSRRDKNEDMRNDMIILYLRVNNFIATLHELILFSLKISLKNIKVANNILFHIPLILLFVCLTWIIN